MKLSVPVVYYSIVVTQGVVMRVSVAEDSGPASHIIKFAGDHRVAVKKKLMIK